MSRQPDLVVAFPGGRGTADMVGRARSAGIEVIDLERRRAAWERQREVAGDDLPPASVRLDKRPSDTGR